ncbi:MAG: hypothetical protein HY562_00065 [Ignavibacteriales bacterium]|nr:hypothetical protein [Ignavibacteriales bacterium]
MNRLFRSAVLVFLMFMVLMFLEPPISLLAWVLALAIIGSLVYIVVSAFNNRKRTSQQ